MQLGFVIQKAQSEGEKAQVSESQTVREVSEVVKSEQMVEQKQEGLEKVDLAEIESVMKDVKSEEPNTDRNAQIQLEAESVNEAASDPLKQSKQVDLDIKIEAGQEEKNLNLESRVEDAVFDEEKLKFKGFTAEDLIRQSACGLDYFQLVAEPRVLPEEDNDSDQVVEQPEKEQINIMTFGDMFNCMICFGIMKEPVAVRSCLHKFCQECIRELYRTSRMCPQCRTPITSNRVWRQDDRTSKILSILIDDIDTFNAVEAQRIEDELKQVFDFNLFSRVMLEHQIRQQRATLNQEIDETIKEGQNNEPDTNKLLRLQTLVRENLVPTGM